MWTLHLRDFIAATLLREKYLIFHFHHCNPLLFAPLRSISLVIGFSKAGIDVLRRCDCPTL